MKIRSVSDTAPVVIKFELNIVPMNTNEDCLRVYRT
jgi:hypothetical protein